MPSRPVVVVALAIVAASLVAGVATFPAALEPGRSERGGITIEAVLGKGDWFRGSAQTVVVPREAGGVIVQSGHPGLLLVTRGLAIEPHRCYVARLVARTPTGGVRLGIYTENLSRRIGVAALRVTARPITHELRFAAGGRRRVSAAILGSLSARAEVVRLVLNPRRC